MTHHERYRAYYKAYHQRPEVKQRDREHSRKQRQDPEYRRKHKEYVLHWYKKNRERILATHRHRQLNEPGFAEKKRQYVKKYLKKMKAKIHLALGNICACCGESTPEFLTLDHIHGGGTKHRRVAGGNQSVYREVLAEGIPKEKYRLLCMNCNFAFGHWGKCPHANKR